MEVLYDRVEKEHELTIQLLMRFIGDGIKYAGKIKNGRKGYGILDGTDFGSVAVKRKDGRGWR